MIDTRNKNLLIVNGKGDDCPVAKVGHTQPRTDIIAAISPLRKDDEAVYVIKQFTNKPVSYHLAAVKRNVIMEIGDLLLSFRRKNNRVRNYPKRDFGLYLIDSHAGVETLISGGFEHQGLLFNYRFLRLLR